MGLRALFGSLFLVLFLVVHAVHVNAHPPKFRATEWKHAHGTFYEGSSDTFGTNLLIVPFMSNIYLHGGDQKDSYINRVHFNLGLFY